MPCSCQKNKTKDRANQNVRTAITTVNTGNQTQTRVIQPRSQLLQQIAAESRSIDNWQYSDSSYDFTPTTEPMDTCAYCAMKHIALASALIQFGDYFSAAGQLQLAGYHYNTANIQLSSKCKETARLFITDPKEACKHLAQLLPISMQYPAEGDSKQTNPGGLGYDPVASIVHVAAAQALIYTQVFYQHLNKAYAVGQLIIAAVNIQSRHRDIARGLRQVWKVIQQMQEPNDVHYKKAQQLLLDCKEKLYTVVRQQTVSGQSSAVQVQIVDNTQGTNAIPVN